MSPMSWNSGSHTHPTSSGTMDRPRRMASMLTIRLRWVRTAPLGAMVLPEVYWTSAGESGDTVCQVGPASMALLRFHLLSLKAEAYLLLRLQNWDESKAILTKLIELDEKNRLGVKEMLEVAEDTSP